MITNPLTGILNKPTAVLNAVKNATNTPTQADRLGTTAPALPVAPTQNTATQNLVALNSATANAAQTTQSQQAAQEAQAAQAAPAPAPQPTALQQTLQSILGIGSQLESKGQRSLEIQQGEGVFDKKARTQQLSNEMLARSQAYEKQIREAMKNNEGKLRSGVATDVDALQMRSAQELADLSIAYKVAQDDYEGAWEIAKAKIDAEFEPLQQKLDTLKTYYQLAQNDMTESEKLQAEQKIREQEQTLAFERDKEMASYKAMIDRETSAYEQQLQQSDPLYQAQLAKARSVGESWSERASILKLAEMGDPVAINALGYDPSQTPTKQNAQAIARDNAMKELDKVNGLVNNALGISSSSGTIQSPLLAQMLGLGATGAGIGAGSGAFVGGVGAIPGAVGGGLLGLATGAVTGSDAKRKKEDFLAQVDYILSGDSFDKFRELKQGGVTFGQTTEKEWMAIQKAANELESFAIRDSSDGKLIGFKGSEASLKRMLTEYQAKVQAFANSFVNESNAVDKATLDEIIAIMRE